MILLTYNLRDKIENMEKFIASIKCSRKVFVYILDLRSNKTEIQNISKENLEVGSLKVAFEDSNKTLDITYGIALQTGITCYSNIEENVVFTESLDLMLTDEFLDNNNISICFSDFKLKMKNSVNSIIPILYKSHPQNIRSCPLVFIKAYKEELIQEAIKNKMGYLEFISSIFVVKHVPELMCCVNNE